MYQMLTKCKTLPYESLAWASKSNITGRNCFRMQLFISNVFFFILFNFHLTRKIFSQAFRLSCELDTLINRTLVYVHTHVSCRCLNNLHQIDKIKQQQKQNIIQLTRYCSYFFLFFCGRSSAILVPSPYNTSIP